MKWLAGARSRVHPPSPSRALATGLLASSAYLAAQVLDRRLIPNEYDDLVLWGGIFSRRPRRQQALGLLVHYTVGLSLATLYDAIEPALPDLPQPLGGILFVAAEHAVTFPGAVVGTRVHPAVRRGDLPDLWTGQYFLVETLRHLAFGLVLGLTYSALNPHSRSGRSRR